MLIKTLLLTTLPIFLIIPHSYVWTARCYQNSLVSTYSVNSSWDNDDYSCPSVYFRLYLSNESVSLKSSKQSLTYLRQEEWSLKMCTPFLRWIKSSGFLLFDCCNFQNLAVNSISIWRLYENHMCRTTRPGIWNNWLQILHNRFAICCYFLASIHSNTTYGILRTSFY